MALAVISLGTPQLWKQFEKVLSGSVIQVLDRHIMAERMDIADIEAYDVFEIKTFIIMEYHA